ncbi:MAG: hypothetical protein RIC11_08400 [Botrimarina sp.]
MAWVASAAGGVSLGQQPGGVLLNPAAPDSAVRASPSPEEVKPERLPLADADIGPTRPADVLLNRPLSAIELAGDPAPEVAANNERLRPENRIRDLAAESIRGPAAAGAPIARFGPSGFAWAAPAVYHRPLLFEQPNLERYGHHHALCEHDHLTPSAISAAHFFGALPAVPYWVGAYGPCEHQYTLGAYRPGSCNPHQLVLPRPSLRGLAVQAAATTGAVFLVP